MVSHLQELITAQPLVWMRGKSLEQLKLHASERHLVTLKGVEPACFEIQDTASEADVVWGRWSTCIRVWVRCDTHTAHDAVNPGEEFARIEWLGEVIVSTHLQPRNPISDLARRRQHDNAHRVMCV